MTLLTMVQGAAAQIGIPVPSVVSGNTDANVAQLLALAQVEGKTLCRQHNWSVLAKQSTVTTVAAEDQGTVATTIGSDLDHIVSGTAWDRSLIRPLPGPRSPQAWAQDHALVAAGPFYGWRIYQGHLWIFPVPSAGKTLTFEYQSVNWCQSNSGTGQSEWSRDTDTGILDELLMGLGLIWRFKAAKGLEYAEDMRNYELMLQDRKSRDGGGPVVRSLTGRLGRYPAWPVLPDGNWPTS